MPCAALESRAALLVAFVVGCATPPPASRFPSADAALERMRASYACTRGVSVEAKLEYVGPARRIRADVLYLAHAPDRVRFDVTSSLGATLSTLASNGRSFSLSDLRERSYVYGPASACNLARFTRVPLAPHALVDLLRGEAPVLVHRPEATRIEWRGGRYVLEIRGAHGANEVIELAPRPEDFGRSWREQRVRVLGVRVEQLGVPLYEIELEHHARFFTAPARVDPDGIEPPVPPSGPDCDAELPRRVRIDVPGGGHDLVLSLKSATHNPPLVPAVFEPERPGGLTPIYSACE